MACLARALQQHATDRYQYDVKPPSTIPSACALLALIGWLYYIHLASLTIISRPEVPSDKYYVIIPRQHQRVVYNRVPKCGSTTTQHLLQILAKRNNFKYSHSTDYIGIIMPTEQQAALYQQIVSFKPPYFLDRHFHFVKFNNSRRVQINYINLIRDPLERLISHYYYRRQRVISSDPISDADKNRTYDDCVLQDLPECTAATPTLVHKGRFHLIPYFCGQDIFCREPSRRSLNQAKEHVVKHYIVVGLLEEYDRFLRVAQRLLPTFFSGALQLYNENQKNKVWRKTMRKLPPSAEVLKIMKKKLRYEYEFYRFIKSHFSELYTKLFNDTQRNI